MAVSSFGAAIFYFSLLRISVSRIFVSEFGLFFDFVT
jgi:hypothetical protein